MDILAFIGLIFLFLGVYKFATTILNPTKPKRPKPTRPELTEEAEAVTYNWELASITNNYKFSEKIYINKTELNRARNSLLDTSPSKLSPYSDDEAYRVAKEEIFHPRWGIDSMEIEQLIDYIKRERNEQLLSSFETINMLLSFVHDPNIQYQYDKDSTGYSEYFRYPLETLYDRVGDCDCKAILAATILYKLGFEVAFLLMPGHAAVAVSSDKIKQAANVIFNGKPWYYCETTGSLWQAGQLPQGFNWREIKLYELEGYHGIN